MTNLVAVYRGVLLYGDSGSGKSSLVNAGLIPEAIGLGFAPERLRVQPRASEELVIERIVGAEGPGQELLPSVLALDDESSARTVLAIDTFEERVRAAGERHRLLLIFDQFEEIVTLFDEAGSREAQQRLVGLLVRLLRGSLPVKVLLSFREDYLGRVKELLSACPELIDQGLRIAPPAAEALPTIIRGPFKRYPGHFARELSPALAGHLVTVLAERFGTGDISLSEVQTVCLRLWQSDDPEALLAAKGPQGLLEDYLGEALDRMPAQRRAAAIALLAQMVTSAGTRNLISAGDLVQRVREQESRVTPGQLEDALEGLSQSRLVRREARRDLDLYEITSEFLVPWISRRRDGFRKSQDRRREHRRLLIIGSIAAAFVLITAIVALLIVANQQRDFSQREAALATAAALASDAQVNAEKAPDIALLLSLAALESDPEAVARSDMIEALEETQLKGVAGILHGDTGPVDSVAFSPNGRTLATGSQDGTARLWDVGTHTQLGSPLAVNAFPVTSVAFSPGGSTLAVGGDYGTVQLWNVASHGPAGSPLAAKSATDIVFSPDGRILAIASQDCTVQLWDLATGRPIGAPLPVGPSPVTSIAISPDGRILATGGQYGTVRLWNVADPARPVALGQPLAASAASVTSLAFSPDGRLVAAARQDGTVRLWDVATQRQLGPPLTAGTGFVNSVAFSPDGSTLAGGGQGGTVWLWDVATHRLVGSLLTASLGSVDCVAFSPDGRTLASGSSDGTVELWDLATAKQPGSTLTAGIQVGSYTSVAFSSGSDVLAAGGGDGTVQLWDTATGRQLGSLQVGNVVDSVAFSPDGPVLASGSGNGTVWLWNVADPAHPVALGQLLAASAGPVTSVAFSADGSILASASQNGTVRLWNTGTRTLLGTLTVNGGPVYSVAFSIDGTLAAASQDGTVRLWNTATGQPLGSPLTTYAGPVTSVAFSADGSILASASQNGTVRLWDTATRQQLGLPLTGQTGPVTSVAFSPDGSILASASQDGTVRLWDTATGLQLGLPLTPNAGPLTSVAFSPDGGTLAAGGNQTVWLGSGFLWSNFAELSNQVCSMVGAGLSRAEWDLYAPGLAYQNSCP